jgi:hypothetical protein
MGGCQSRSSALRGTVAAMRNANLDKTQIARRQLGTALALFIADLDPVCVHVLACGGGEIAQHLTVKASREPFRDQAIATFPDLSVEKIRGIRNRYWNAFKHATTRKGLDRADKALLEKFADIQNDHALFVGWYDYSLATSRMPIEAQAFQTWYFALYPDKLNPDVDVSAYEAHFPRLLTLSRQNQKRALRAAIARARMDADVMSNAATESGPLIVSA